ncbi:type I-E CRISPR-associated protein Cas5/CasD [Saccharopolyspora sp. ID03-671]|uniref:type I-E CRISPR-associated protein Cas5/CasD n=1 Tax=Saccharopolyspora sp. ID03-671 TaxID=3073066 RepID=UPI003251CAE1
MSTPHTLAVCLDAPMQSWGLRSRFQNRDTAHEPTKSGVVGLLAAALGIPRENTSDIQRLAQVRMGVRVDREGLVERDFHTVNNVPNTAEKDHKTVISDRYYLADAVFLVVLEHPDRDKLLRWHAALHHPHWPLYLGRKAFVPARPLVHPDHTSTFLGVSSSTLDETLDAHPWLENQPTSLHRATEALQQGREVPLRTLSDAEPTDELAEPRRDVPVSFAPGNHLFATRPVRTGHVQLTESLIHSGAHPCT